MNRILLLSALLTVVLFSPSCSGGGSSPTESGRCESFSGTYRLSYGTACQVQGEVTVAVAQAGCNVSFTVPTIGSFSGEVRNRVANLSVQLDPSCGGQTVGQLQRRDNGVWDLAYGDGQACCRHGGGEFRR